MTRSPILNTVDPLQICRDGTVWMTWRLRALPYGYRAIGDKLAVRDHHTQLFRALRGEFLLRGVLAPKDPIRVVDQMVAGVDLERCPAWAAECAETLALLADNPVEQRLFYLSVPLPIGGVGLLAAGARAAWSGFVDRLGLPRNGVGPEMVRRLLARAEEIKDTLPLAFRPTPVTAAEQLWLQSRAQLRGVFDGIPCPIEDRELAAELVARSVAAGGIAVLDEGARADLPPRAMANPLTRRYLRVTADTEEVGYQSLLLLADTPPQGMAEVGSEFLGRLDDTGVSLDWAVRGRIRTQQEVLRRNKRAKNTLEDQVGQRDQDGAATGKLHRSLLAMQEYEELMLANDQEVEVDCATILICSGQTAEQANDDAVTVQNYFRDSGFKLVRPPGGQSQAWWASMPGTSLAQLPLVKERMQIAPAASMAVSMPMVSTELGDSRGALFALNITTLRPTPVLLDITGNAERDISGSCAFCGELGSGKSVAMRSIVGATVDRGGRFIATDQSDTGEWATFADTVAGSCVVDTHAPVVGLDPLKMFGLSRGGQVAKTFLALLLGIDLRGDLGQLLARVLKPTYLERHTIDSLGSLLDHLEDACTLSGAKKLAGRMSVFADQESPEAGIAQVVFDTTLPPLDLNCRAVVIRTLGTELPSSDELRHEHLAKTLGVEKLFGRALFALIALIAKEICFASPSDPALFVVDETASITLSIEGERILEEFIRRGRRNGAAVVLGSHDAGRQDDAGDFGSETLRELIPIRVVLRHRSKPLARNAITWLGLEPDDEELVKLITEDTSPVEDEEEYTKTKGMGGVRPERRGEALMRDSLNRFGRVKVLLPLNAERRAATLTTPSAV